jgi:hypothetical protein
MNKFDRVRRHNMSRLLWKFRTETVRQANPQSRDADPELGADEEVTAKYSSCLSAFEVSLSHLHSAMVRGPHITSRLPALQHRLAPKLLISSDGTTLENIALE